METQRKQDPFTPHPLKSSCELDFADRKGMAKMETAVHVGIREGAKPFRMLCLHVIHRQLLGEKFCMRGYAFG